MFTAPPMQTMPVPASVQTQQVQTNAQLSLQNYFPGWKIVNSQPDDEGNPRKAHITDHAGQAWTIWFNSSGNISSAAEGSQ